MDIPFEQIDPKWPPFIQTKEGCVCFRHCHHWPHYLGVAVHYNDYQLLVPH
ncbi:hypothetical protein SBF1_1600003 [Candidatus Desulfosporosinus infrequens]|uniref:Uncharacterized protein n=1 Tax=Candidatus Desulfosporosinus infrequens TaxID=2043169 RepID=A0A2U3K9Z5_9FIRM|nr:hypothetical protein SBF1_1600003 [Candidatus Desulfosporosinus infrequens]